VIIDLCFASGDLRIRTRSIPAVRYAVDLARAVLALGGDGHLTVRRSGSLPAVESDAYYTSREAIEELMRWAANYETEEGLALLVRRVRYHGRRSSLDGSSDNLSATIQQAEVTSDQRALNVVPALIADLGEEAAWRYVEFFTANIRNPNTRRAYARACNRFFAWCEDRGLTPAAIRPHDVATYIEELQLEVSAPSVKQQLAAIRMLFDWLVIGQVVPNNPAAGVRGPKHVVKTGKTPVLEGAE
jgi:hypothetical protein